MKILYLIALVVVLVGEALLALWVCYAVHRMRLAETEMRSLGFVVEGHGKRLQALEGRTREKKRSEGE